MTTLPNTPANIPAVVTDFGYNLFHTADSSPLSPVFSGKRFNFGNSVKVGYELACGETTSLSNVACNGLNIGGKLVHDRTPVTTNLLLTPERILKLVGKSWGQLSAVSACAVGFMAASNIIAHKVNVRDIVAQTSDADIYADHWYGYRFVEGECDSGFNFLITGRANGELVFKASSLPPVQTPTTSIPFVDFFTSRPSLFGGLVTLSADEAKQYGFEQGVTLRQVQEVANMLATYPGGYKVHDTNFSGKYTVNQMLCLCGFMQYVYEWEWQEQCAAAEAAKAEAIEPAPETETTEATEVESSEPAETTDVQDCISGPTESSGSALAPTGATALALPATAPIFVPEAAITVNKSAPSFFRDVNAGLCKAVPKFSTDEPETTANGPLVPVCGDTNHVSFDYCGHHYELEYSDEGWRWTFDDFKDQEGRGFLFKAEGMTLTEMAKRIDLDARYLGELVFHIEQALEIKLGKFENPSFEFVTIDYSLGYELRDLPTFSLLGAKVYLPLRTRKGRIEFCSDLAIAEWRMDVAAFGAMMLNRAGFIPSDAANFMKGWITSALWCIEDEVQLRAFENDLADEIPF